MSQYVRAALVGLVLAGVTCPPARAQAPAAPAATPAPAGTMTPLERVKWALERNEKLKNPFTGDSASIAWAQNYFRATCGGCHGGTGGGGMCPPVSNEVWIYGSDDDVLFKLIALGSVELQKLGYIRLRKETIVGPMPAFGAIIKTDQDLWKAIAYIRSVYKGSAASRTW